MIIKSAFEITKIITIPIDFLLKTKVGLILAAVVILTVGVLTEPIYGAYTLGIILAYKFRKAIIILLLLSVVVLFTIEIVLGMSIL